MKIQLLDNNNIKLYGGRYSDLYYLPRKWSKTDFSFTMPAITILDLMDVYPALWKDDTAIELYKKEINNLKHVNLIKSGDKYIDKQQLTDAGFKGAELIRKYQLMGITLGISQGGIILAFDMGLGKGLVSLAVSLWYKHIHNIKNVLIVCPNSIKFSVWEREIKKWTDESYIIVTPQNKNADFSKYFYTVINYEMLIRLGDFPTKDSEIDMYNIELFPIQPEFIILDEAHSIKNPKSKRTKLLHKFAGTPAILASGTPVLNKTDELWSLLHFIKPEYWNKYYDFVNRYCVVEDKDIWTRRKGGKAMKRSVKSIVGAQNTDELQKRISLWHIAKTKQDVMPELPELIKEERVVDLTSSQNTQYKSITNDIISNVGDKYDKKQAMISLHTLLQLCDSFKTTEVLDIVDGISSSSKTVIFAWYVSTVNNIVCELQKNGYDVVSITGETKPNDRENNIKRFQEDPKCSILVATIATCSVGLDFSMASNCIFLSRSYTPAINDQAVSRLHRSGQKNSVTEIVIYCRNTAEERVHEILEQKRNLIDAIFSKEEFMKLLLHT